MSASAAKERGRDLPKHLRETSGSNRTARCRTCGRRVTIGTDGVVEYGHARQSSEWRGARRPEGMHTSCPHRPASVEPTRR